MENQAPSHWIEIPLDLREKLNNEVISLIESGKNGLKYERFVNNLFKEMENSKETLLHAAVGVAGEAGEMLELVKKHWAYGKKLDPESLIREMGDLIFYFTKIMNMLGITIHEVRGTNFAKLRARYPTGSYSDEQAIARADVQQ